MGMGDGHVGRVVCVCEQIVQADGRGTCTVLTGPLYIPRWTCHSTCSWTVSREKERGATRDGSNGLAPRVAGRHRASLLWSQS
jgi:hypothetical protein